MNEYHKQSREEAEKQPLQKQSSFKSLDSSDANVCRICHCEGDDECPLISPCACSGEL